jgi:hypothetical protein
LGFLVRLGPHEANIADTDRDWQKRSSPRGKSPSANFTTIQQATFIIVARRRTLIFHPQFSL